MIIDFNKLDTTVIKNFYGGEKDTVAKMFSDNINRIMQGKLEPGASIGFHKHETSSEIIYILQGKAKVIYDDGEEQLEAGMCHYCPKGHSHSFINNGNEALITFAIVLQQ